MMNLRSIRFRLSAWFALALTAGLVIFALALWITMRQSVMKDVADLAAAQLQSAEEFTAAELTHTGVHLGEELDEFAHGLANGTLLEVRDAEGRTVFSSNATFTWPTRFQLDGGLQKIRWKSNAYLVLSDRKSIAGKALAFRVAAPSGEADRLLNRLAFFLAVLLPFVAFAAVIAGFWLSRRALAPVDQMTAAAKSISLENLSDRLFVPQTGDELQRLAETWNVLLSRLDAALQRLSRFTAEAAHELRTPVAIIRTTAELAARRDRPTESYRAALSEVVAESEKMTRLLDDLLFLARVDADAVEFPKTDTDLGLLVEQTCQEIRPLADAKNLQINVSAADTDVVVPVNQAAIRRLLLVLLDNAIRYSKTAGELDVSLSREGGRVQVEVADSGPGISAEDLPHIFERFYRSADVRGAGAAGSGLGLALAAAIAQKHNAELSVTRSTAEGSTFCLFLRANNAG